jgi:hypothetical protein
LFRFELDALVDLVVGRVKPTAKHEVLPDEDTALVADAT